MKYVWLAANSDQKAKADMEKYDLARKLKSKIKSKWKKSQWTPKAVGDVARHP